ncbi:MAG: YlxR family protein [Acidimicrobiia bacterium]
MGCRRRLPQSAARRVAAAQDGSVGFGPGAPGRGAWLCDGSAACFEAATKRGALARALRRTLMPDELAMIRARMLD